MPDRLVISVDAMGGDHGPDVTLSGVARATKFLVPGARFLLHGDAARMEPVLARLPALASVCEVRPAESVIPMDAKPAHAMRRGKGSSMWNAVECLRAEEAQAVVSAGNTGALMAISRLLLRMTGDMDRPALVANWPTLRGVTSVLDVGANIVCDADRLVEFAIMGAAFHRAIHKTARPSVGLLNVGTETEKGHDDVREADRRLRASEFALDYHGFVEGDDIAKGTVDVIVTDGFTGNVALKTAEGLARFFTTTLRTTFTADAMSKLGALIARRSLKRMSERLDPGSINGGPFLGLNGIVIKSHGGADARGFANAIRVAAELAASDFVRQLDDDLSKHLKAPGASATAPAASRPSEGIVAA